MDATMQAHLPKGMILLVLRTSCYYKSLVDDAMVKVVGFCIKFVLSPKCPWDQRGMHFAAWCPI